MISVSFSLVCSRRVAEHAEPIAALDALKLARLLFSQPIVPAIAPFNRRGLPERRETTLIAPIARDPCEKCGLARISRAP